MEHTSKSLGVSWSSYRKVDSIRAATFASTRYAVVVDNSYTWRGVQADGRPGANDRWSWKCASAPRGFVAQRPLLHRPMQAFVTVGSTKFDDLIDAIASEQLLARLFARGYTRLVVQHGNSKLPKSFQTGASQDVEVISWSFKPNLTEEYHAADLIISHAGPPFSIRPVPFADNLCKALVPFWKC